MTTQQTQGGASIENAGPVTADPHAVHAHGGPVAEKEVFCAACQAVTKQKLSRIQDSNGNHEIVATCDCGRALKFPLSDDLPQHLEAHAAANKGQVSVEVHAAQQAEHDARFKKIMGIAD
jgi:RNase P subunit RPR2